MTDKIRFAQFVLSDIATNGGQPFEQFMGGHYYADIRRGGIGNYERFAESNEDNDSWNLFVRGWIWRDVYLSRGPKAHKIDLTKEETKLLINAWDRMEIDRKEANKRKVSKAEQERLDAAWWP